MMWKGIRKNQRTWGKLCWNYLVWETEHKKNEQNFRDPSLSKRHTKIGIRLFQKKRRRKKEQKEYLKTQNLVNLVKKKKKKVYPNSLVNSEYDKLRRSMCIHILIKLWKAKGKERTLKTSRKNCLVMFKESSRRLTPDFSSGTIEDRKQ